MTAFQDAVSRSRAAVTRAYAVPWRILPRVKIGQELYAYQLARPNGTGIDIYTQSNPLPIVKRPALTVRLHSSTGW